MNPMHCLIWDDERIASYQTVLAALLRFDQSLKIHVDYRGKKMNHPCRRDAEALIQSHSDIASADIVLHVCPDEDVLELIEEVGQEIALAFLDEYFDSAPPNPYYGSRVLAPLLRKKKPDVTLVIASAHATDDKRIADGVAEGQISIWVDKAYFNDEQTGVARLLGSLFLSQLQKHRLAQQLLTQQFMNSQFNIARLPIGGSTHIRQIVGMDDTLKAINKQVATFLKYKEFVDNKVPLEYRWAGKLRPFTMAIALTGEPGSGKTTIIKGLAQLFSNTSCEEFQLPRDAHPGAVAGAWKAPWEKFKAKILKCYETDGIWLAVIDDNTMFSYSPNTATDGALAADWANFLRRVKDLIAECNQKNNKTNDNNQYLYKGKVLWIMAFNPSPGSVDQAFYSLFTKFSVNFPTETAIRKIIIRHEINKSGMKITDKALDLLIEKTQCYSGRDFLGQDNVGAGVIHNFYMDKAYNQDEPVCDNLGNEIDTAGSFDDYWTITEKEVIEWIMSEMHAEIMREYHLNNHHAQVCQSATSLHCMEESDRIISNKQPINDKINNNNDNSELSASNKFPEIDFAEKLLQVLRSNQLGQELHVTNCVALAEGNVSHARDTTVASRRLQLMLKLIFGEDQYCLHNQEAAKADPRFDTLRSDPLLQIVWRYAGERTITWKGVVGEIREQLTSPGNPN